MSEPIEGSVEIKTANGMSIGVPGQRWTLDAVPLVLDTLHGIGHMESVTPERQSTGRTPEAQWSAVDANNQTITVILWRDIPYDETTVAQAIAAAIVEGEASRGS